ncbi:MAG: TraR/DksA family transcriptional regulator [Planctomycetota bacterium]
MAKKAKKTSKKKATAKKPVAKKKKQAKKTAVRKKVAKKTVAKKTPKKKVRKKTKKRTLTAKEVQHFKELLLHKRAEIIGDVSSIESEALKKSRLDAAGDLSSMPIHMADLGTDNFEQEFALGLMDSERKILSEINDALKRIDEGVYGICEGTGKPIAKARLQANPWARYGIKYATMVEQGLVIEGEKIAAGSREEYESNDELDRINDFEELDEDDEFDDE